MKKTFLVLSLFFLTGCTTLNQPHQPVPQSVIVIGPSDEIIQQCVDQIHREDVPYHTDGTPTTTPENNGYTRKLEDAYQFCRDALVQSGQNAADARARAAQVH